jgi:hypothetical protein
LSFSAKLPSPGGHFDVDVHGVVWRADDENAPPYTWGFASIDQAEAYFTQILKTIRLAQIARYGR